MKKEYIAYFRVSTIKQGRSGLGLSAQQSQVKDFIKAKGGTLLTSFQETESGKRKARPQLVLALQTCKKEGAILIVAKLDRLSRDVSFIFSLRDAGVDFVCTDLPDFNTLTLGLFATIAQHEREMISQRTRLALQEKKKQGIKLGSPKLRTKRGKEAHLKLLSQRRTESAIERNQMALQVITPRIEKNTWQGERNNLTRLANYLNRKGIRTPNGKRYLASSARNLLNLQRQAHGLATANT